MMSNEPPDRSERLRWWFWPYFVVCLLLSPLFFLVFLVLAVVSVPVEFCYRLRQRREEQRLRPRLAAAGRLIEWAEVEAKFGRGEGTLIVQHCSPKGPIREWWTEDDLAGAAPAPLPVCVKSPPAEGQLQVLRDYAGGCSGRYVDLEAGTAKLTEVPTPVVRRLDPRKYVVVDLGGGLMTAILLVTGRKLHEKYPRGRVVTLVDWFDEPVLFAGDAEAVFLGPAEPSEGSGSQESGELS